VFAGEDDRAWLEGLVWPLVAERRRWLAEGARATAPRAAAVEVPLPFEALAAATTR
jgi:hypothetical protein